MPPSAPLPVVLCPSEGFLTSRGCESWNPGWPAIDLCHCAFAASSKVTLHVSFALHSSAFAPVVHQLYYFPFLFSICWRKPLWFLPTTSGTRRRQKCFFCCSFMLSRWKLPGDYTSQLRRTRKKKKKIWHVELLSDWQWKLSTKLKAKPIKDFRTQPEKSKNGNLDNCLFAWVVNMLHNYRNHILKVLSVSMSTYG